MLAHLLIAVAGGIGAAVAASMSGQPLWIAAFLYVLGGNVALLGSVALSVLRSPRRDEAPDALFPIAVPA